MSSIETRARLVSVTTKTGDEDTDPEAKLVFTIPVDDEFLQLLRLVRTNQREFYLGLSVVQAELPGMATARGNGSARIFPGGDA